MVKAAQVVDFLERIAPPQLAEAWDNSGLQAGSLALEVSSILLTLDVDMAILEAAEALSCQMVVSHHPLIIDGLKGLDTQCFPGSVIRRAILNDMLIYSLHTNLDSVRGGVSDCLADALGLEETEVLQGNRDQYYKLVVFVPRTHLEDVRSALGAAGAGQIGQYSHCSFATPGEGFFRPEKDAKPFLGTEGTLERVAEYRLETIVKSWELGKVLTAMAAAHPYEEAAYDLFPLLKMGDSGLGRVGHLPQPMKLQQFARHVLKRLDCPGLRITGREEKALSRIAVVGGSGGDLIRTAWLKGADCLVAGDIKYHQARQAQELGLALVDPGHYHSEKVVLDFLRQSLAGHFGPDLEINVYSQGLDRDPFQWIVDSQEERGEH